MQSTFYFPASVYIEVDDIHAGFRYYYNKKNKCFRVKGYDLLLGVGDNLGHPPFALWPHGVTAVDVIRQLTI